MGGEDATEGRSGQVEVRLVFKIECKGSFHLRFSGIRPLRGYPPPPPLTENQSEKRRFFSLAEKGGTPPLNGRIPLKRK